VGMAIGPEGGLTVGTLVAFAFLVTIFLEPVAEFTEILDMTQQAVAGWKKVLDVLDTPVEVEDPRPGLVLPARALDIDVDRVSFAYHGGPPVLTEVSVAIPAGTRVALVETSGSPGPTCARSAWPRCARPWSWSPRTASCSTPASPATSAWAGPRPATARCGPPSRRWGWTAGSRGCRGACTPGSASSASTCRWASAS